MKNFIVEQYDTYKDLEDGLNSVETYFPLEIFSNKDYYTVVYCKKSILRKQNIEMSSNNNIIKF